MSRVLIADDHGVVREGLRRVLSRMPDIEIVGEAAIGEQALEMRLPLEPDLGMLDLSMPERGGLDVLATRQTGLPAPPAHAGSAYIKQIARATLEISVVGAAAYVALDSPGGTVTDARIALGAVGPTPPRAPTAEAELVGQPYSEALARAAGEAARLDARPIDDHRGSATYRLEMVEVLVRRAVARAAERAAQRGGSHA